MEVVVEVVKVVVEVVKVVVEVVVEVVHFGSGCKRCKGLKM